jgi:hypothetical protein
MHPLIRALSFAARAPAAAQCGGGGAGHEERAGVRGQLAAGGRRVHQRVKAVTGGARGAAGVPVPTVQAPAWILLVRQGVRLLGEGM